MSVGRFLGAGTSHITAAEAARLPDGIDCLPVDAHEYGWWLWVDQRPVRPDEEADEFRRSCPNIAAVLDHARGLGCEWVNLDAGGEILDGLPTFEW